MARRRKRPEPTDIELCALAAGVLLLYASALTKATALQRLTWESCNKLHIFAHKLGASRRTACIVNEICYHVRFKNLSIPAALAAARRELSKPIW